MIFPRFGIRTVLLIMAGIGVASLFVSHAVRGREWALAMSLGFGVFIVFFLLSAATYAVATVIARALRGPDDLSEARHDP